VFFSQNIPRYLKGKQSPIQSEQSAEREKFILTVYSNREDSTVYIDNKSVGIAGSINPLRLSRPQGTYKVSVGKKNFSKIDFPPLYLTKNESLAATLNQTEAVLALTFNVQDVKIFLNGVEYNSTGNRFTLALPPATYQIRLEKHGYKTVDQKIVLTSDMEVPRINLPPMFILKIKVNIDQSTVLINGKTVDSADTKNPAEISLPAGKYTVEVTNNLALSPFKQTVQLIGDDTLEAVLQIAQLTKKIKVDKNEIGKIVKNAAQAKTKPKKSSKDTVKPIKNILPESKKKVKHVHSTKQLKLKSPSKSKEKSLKKTKPKVKTKHKKNTPLSKPSSSIKNSQKKKNCQTELGLGLPELCD